MADPTHTSQLLAGRKWTVSSKGFDDLSREYLVRLDGGAPLGPNGEIASFPGVPAIGSVHPNIGYLYADHYEVSEGSDKDKHTLRVTVKYKPQDIMDDAPSGSTEPDDSAVEEWGWSAGTEQHELVTDATGTDVLNSAGDPFDSVPTVDSPAPTFTKVIRTKTRRMGWFGYNCKVNSGSVTIGGVSFDAKTLLCAIAEQRIIGDGEWKYRYTISLKYRTNSVDIANSGSPIEIGWDVAIADTGMRQIDQQTGEKVLIRDEDPETHKMATVSSPTLLDGQGHKQTSGYNAVHNFRFAAYETTTFPNWFYSEPGAVTPQNNPNNGNGGNG